MAGGHRGRHSGVLGKEAVQRLTLRDVPSIGEVETDLLPSSAGLTRIRRIASVI